VGFLSLKGSKHYRQDSMMNLDDHTLSDLSDLVVGGTILEFRGALQDFLIRWLLPVAACWD